MLEEFADLEQAQKFVEENASIKTLSGTFSMLIWGLIMAKAKAGYAAASSKDHVTVKS